MFSVLSLIGAIASACIAGIIGFKIIKTRLEPDGMCVPPIDYPGAGDDCELHNNKKNNQSNDNQFHLT